MATYVRTNDVPKDCDYITVNKLYKIIKKISYGGDIILDDGSREYIAFKCCAHINGGDWEIIEMNDDNLPQVGDECEFDNLDDFECPRKGCLKATTSDERFIDEDDIIWKYCRRIKKTIKVVKKASEIIKWCEDHGYEYRKYGLIKQGLTTLFWEKLEFCGKEPYAGYSYHEDWLKEKVID